MLEIPAFSPICNTAHYQKDAPVLIFLLEIFLTLLSQTSRSWSLLGALTSLTRGSFSVWRGWNRRTCSQVERDLMSLLLETIPLSLFFYWSPSAQWSIQSWKQLDTKISETNPSTAVGKITQANLSADNIHQFTSFLVKQGRTGANFYHLSLTKKNLALTRVLIWFHLLAWVGRLGLILIKMNSSALSPLLLALSHSGIYLKKWGHSGVFWNEGAGTFHRWKEATAGAIFSGDGFLQRLKVTTKNLAMCSQGQPVKGSEQTWPEGYLTPAKQSPSC